MAVTMAVSCGAGPKVSGQEAAQVDVVILVPADGEWKPMKTIVAASIVERTPFGEYMRATVARSSVIYMHAGWGKISSAAATAYAIDRWRPRLVIVAGTAGGLGARSRRFEVLLAARTVVYDISEAMGDSAEALNAYSTSMDVMWASKLLPSVRVGEVLTADRDLVRATVGELLERYPEALAADWESGSVAFVSARLGQPLLIMRCVSDSVTTERGDAEGNIEEFRRGADQCMGQIHKAITTLLTRLGDVPVTLPVPATGGTEGPN